MERPSPRAALSSRSSPPRRGLTATPSTPFPTGFSGLAALAANSGHTPLSVDVLPGDVGRRRYLRLHLPGGRSLLGVVYPAEETDSRRRWMAASAALARTRARAPPHRRRRVGQPARRGPRLRRILRRRSPPLPTRAAKAFPPPSTPPPRSRRFRIPASIRPSTSRSSAASWSSRAKRSSISTRRRPLSPDEREVHDRWADALCREILAHPRALCHRDFHGNNLFPVDGGIAAIDFQDLRSGPDTYDIASLLWERTTLDWMTPELADAMIERFARRRALDAAALRGRFDRVLLQRAWKVCGTFARAVAAGRGEAYRRYLPGEIALVGRLLAGTGEDAGVPAALRGAPGASAKLSPSRRTICLAHWACRNC